MSEGARSGLRDGDGTESWGIDAVRPVVAVPVWRPLPEAGDLLGGRFFLRRVLGAGATGVVFEALDHTTRRDVALKLLRPEAVSGNSLERLRREIRLSQPGHTNVVRLHDLHEAGGFLVLSMELFGGPSLHARLSEARCLPIEDVIAIGRQVAAALAYLHANGLVHRDVKPGNILVAPSGLAKLCDLGLVRPVDHGLTVTESRVVVGTPAYMAPEQAIGQELTGAADVYALGLTLWQALAGKVPLVGNSAIETLTRRQRDTPPLRPDRADCPEWLARLLRRMLAPRSAERPTASEIEAALAGRRFRPVPRARAVAAVAVSILAVLGFVVGARAFLGHRTVRFEKAGQTVRGVDARGKTTWSKTFESPVQQLLEADLDGDGRNELVAVAFGSAEPATGLDRLPFSEVAVFSAEGIVVTRLRPEETDTRWAYGFPKRFQPSILVIDLDRDGRSELVVNCPHWAYFPNVVLVYWPRSNVWDDVLSHSGRVYDLVGVPGAFPRIRFLARNNALGMSLVVGELELTPPASRRSGRPEAIGSMATSSTVLDASDAAATWTGYSLVAESPDRSSQDAASGLEARPGGGTLLRVNGGSAALDSLWNPVGGPNEGQDLRDLRLGFVSSTGPARTRPRRADGPDPIEREMEELRKRFRPLLLEPPYRLAFDLAFAERLALADAPANAVSLLGGTIQAVSGEEAPFRQAVMLSLAGDLGEASIRLRGLALQFSGLRGTFDAPELLLRVGAERKSEEDVALAIETLGIAGNSSGTQPGLVAALRARANLIQDRLSEPDTLVRSWPYAPDGDAIAVLARWRLGRTRAGDARAMETLLEGGNDAAVDGRLALAAVRLATGRPADAARLCEELLRGIDSEARTSFERRQQVQLASALHARALLSSGDFEGARDRAEALVAIATPLLLPANLAREVLAALPDAGGAGL